MKNHIIGPVCWLIFAHWLSAAEIQIPVLQVGSTIYSNIVITDVTATDIYFKHSSGVGNTRLRYLEPDLQQRFNYNPEIAAETERQQDISSAISANDIYKAALSRQRAARQEADVSVAAGSAEINPFADPVSNSSLINKPIPDIKVEKWFSEKPPSAAGKCIIILFWTSQSEACRRVIPELNALQKKHPDDLVVIGITSETEREVSQVTDNNIGFFYGNDPKSATSHATGVTSVPCVLLADSKGIIRYQGHPAAIKEDILARYFVQEPR